MSDVPGRLRVALLGGFESPLSAWYAPLPAPRPLAEQLLRLLLLRGGVEPHPGPAGWVQVVSGRRPKKQQQQQQQALPPGTRLVDGRVCRVPRVPVGAHEVCHRCARRGHYAADCRSGPRAATWSRGAAPPPQQPQRGQQRGQQPPPSPQQQQKLRNMMAWTFDPERIALEGHAYVAMCGVAQEAAAAFAAIRSAFVAFGGLPVRVCPYGCGAALMTAEMGAHMTLHLERARRQLIDLLVQEHGVAFGRVLDAAENAYESLRAKAEAARQEVLAARARKRAAAAEKKAAKRGRTMAAPTSAGSGGETPTKKVRAEDAPPVAESPPAEHCATVAVAGLVRAEDAPPVAEPPPAEHCAAVAVAGLLTALGKPVPAREVALLALLEPGRPAAPADVAAKLRGRLPGLPPLLAVPAPHGGTSRCRWPTEAPVDWDHIVVEADSPPHDVVVVTPAGVMAHFAATFVVVDVAPHGEVAHFAVVPADECPPEGLVVLVGLSAVGFTEGEPEGPEALPLAEGPLRTASPFPRRRGCGRALCSCGARCDAGAAECPLCLASSPRSTRRTHVADAEDEEEDDEEDEEDEDEDEEEDDEEDEDEEEDDEEDEDEEENGEEDEEVERRFATASTRAAVVGARCPVPGCGYAPGQRVGPELARHGNTVHSDTVRRGVAGSLLEASGLTRCEACGLFLPAPAAARSAHRCEAFVSRATVLRETRARFRGAPTPSVPPPPVPPPTRPPAPARAAETRPPPVHVWTDGSSCVEGAGAAAWFAPGDHRNRAARVPEGTNQLAELAAAVLALRVVTGSLVIHTDSQWLLDGATLRSAVAAHPLWDELRCGVHRATFVKIDAHRGITGNEAADALAKLASGACTPAATTERLAGLYGAHAAAAVTDVANCLVEFRLAALPAPAPPPPAPEADVALAPVGRYEPTAADNAFFASRPRTLRSLHRRQFRGWSDAVRGVLGGYTAAPQADRFARQELLTELPRQLLSRPTGVADRPTELTPTQPAAIDADPLEAMARRCDRLVRLGAVGKAARTLCTGSVPPISTTDPAVVEQLLLLHPPEPPNTVPLDRPRSYPALAVTAMEVHAAVKVRLARGSAPGVDGWTRELLVPIVEDRALLHELTSVVGDMLAGRISPAFAWRLRCTAGIALPKPNGKVRPVEPESALAKLACAVALRLVPRTYLNALRPLQRGVGGDVEMAARDVMTAMATAEASVLLDGTNAFGSLHRAEILRQVYAAPELAPLHSLLGWLLEPDARIGFYDTQGNLTTTITSSRGVRQGMLLGPLLFAVGLHTHALRLQTDNPEVAFTLYLDDVTITGPVQAVSEAVRQTVEAFAAIGIQINAAKSTSVLRCDEVPASWTIPVTTSGIVRVLGAGFPVGPTADLTEWVTSQATDSSAPLFDSLRTSPLGRCTSMRILRMCAAPRMNFLIRTHEPDKTAPACKWFDGEMSSTLRHLVGLTLDDRAAQIARLPARLGGLGLRESAETAPLAFASVGVKHAQHKLQKEVDEARHKAVLTSLSGQDRAWLASGSKANRPLYQEECILGDPAFTAWVRQRLLLRVLPPTIRCSCGADATNAHVLACPRLAGGPRTYRHDAILDALAGEITAAAGGITRLEPASGQANRSRPDIVHVAPVGRFAADVTVATPGTGPVHTHGQPAATRAAARKSHSWSAWAEARGIDFVPFVLEATGASTKENAAWLRRLLQHTTTTSIGAASQQVLGAAVAAMLHGQLALFNSASGSCAIG